MERLLVSIAVVVALAPLPGFAAAVDQRAQALLQRADDRRAAGDSAGALAAYMEAVQIDPAAASLEAIARYAPPLDAIDEKARTLHVSALRHYLRLNADDYDATSALERAKAELDVARRISANPKDALAYRDRATLWAQQRDFAGALRDAAKAAELAPDDAEVSYILGVILYEAATKQELPDAQKLGLARRGVKALQRAASLRPDYFDALVYENLLLREQAKLEADPARQKALLAKADALRERAVAIAKQRKQAGDYSAGSYPRSSVPPPAPPLPPPPPPPKSTETPLRVGGDVKAPVVISRVDPVYPEIAQKARVSGIVIVEAFIDSKGQVYDVSILKGLPFGLGEAAVAAVKQWTFKPATRNGEPVAVLFTLTVNMKPKTD